MLSATGRELGRLALGAPLSDGTPALTMKRTRLAAALAQECLRRGIEVRYESGLRSVETTSSGVVRATFADGASRGRRARGRRRRALDNAPADRPQGPAGRYVGLVNFGGITPAGATRLDDAEAEPGSWHLLFGRSAFFGWHTTPSGDVVWFVNEPRPQVGPDERVRTTEREWRTHLAQLFAGDAGPAAGLIRDGVLELAGDNTHDLGHVPTWHRGPLVAIGDAALHQRPPPARAPRWRWRTGWFWPRCCATRRTCPPPSPRTRGCAAPGWRGSSPRVRAAAPDPGALVRPLRDTALRLVFRYAITEKKLAGCTTTASTGSRRWRRRSARSRSARPAEGDVPESGQLVRSTAAVGGGWRCRPGDHARGSSLYARGLAGGAGHDRPTPAERVDRPGDPGRSVGLRLRRPHAVRERPARRDARPYAAGDGRLLGVRLSRRHRRPPVSPAPRRARDGGRAGGQPRAACSAATGSASRRW